MDGPQELVIPPGTQPEAILTLNNRGVPLLNNPASRGDHLITIKVAIPTKISGEERDC